ncbi:branched-chain amino acid ABC transporter permease [Leptolyngbya sp. FACHB-711]|uniref:branched-chain amino acid ABC transporter permease n=1 Tax=unclassified Leptolyngbya TaxID=2650499 RepID=UPI0016871E54|nr:branched-chain amino acid ABC transporter permease [Leptolyngbya sp. FACHB-711]MBD1851297.1 branched-chain amino acid ABC transporter permease [Cyanobacteria bacterium FACHB-502]MBD2026992.1 branched-chain amino acid ABC transporter permease [Leptolyngbya sp. FACHB-711]
MQGFIVSLIIFAAVFAVFSLGLNLQWGYTGLINFGHVAFMTIGAYTTVLLTLQGVPLWVATLAGAAIAALLGLLIGFSTLRLRTDYLAIVTIGVSELIRLVAVNEDWLTRGTFGIQRFALPLAGVNPSLPVRVLMVAVFGGVIALSYWQGWKWLRQQLKSIPQSALVNTSIAALGYVTSLALLLYGSGIIARQLKFSNALPPIILGIGLLVGLAAIIALYVWLAKKMSDRFPAWTSGLTIVMTGILAGLGLWASSYAIRSLYDYSSNPPKNGLMFVSVLIVALLYWALERLARSPWGRILKAIREDEEVAKALGKNVFWYKLQSLMIGGAIAGISGAMYAWQLTTVYPDNFQPIVTFNAWTMVVLGGAGSNAGAILGAAIFWAYQTVTRFILEDIVPLDDARLGAFRVMLIGLLLMVLMIWRPQGILGKKEELTLGR